MTKKSMETLSLFLGLLCTSLVLVKSDPSIELGNDINTLSEESSGRGKDMDSTDFIITAFSKILSSKLENSSILSKFFQDRTDSMKLMNMALSIAESLVNEVSLVDSNSASDLIINTLLSVSPSAEPEDYVAKLINAVGKILLNNKILNSVNYFSFADTVSKIILNVVNGTNDLKLGYQRQKKDINGSLDIAVKSEFGIDTGDNKGIGFKNGIDVVNSGVNGLDIGGKSGFGIDTGNKNGIEIKGGLDVVNVGAGGLNIEAKTGSGIDTGNKNDNAAKSGLNIVNVGTGGLDIDAKTGFGMDTGVGLGVGVKGGLDTVTRTNDGAGLQGNSFGVGLNSADAGLGSSTKLGSAGNIFLNTGSNSLLGVDVNLGLPLNADLIYAVNAGLNTDLNVLNDASIQFKTELANKLLKDVTFRNFFSDFVPPNALKQISAAMCEHVSRAFHVSRSFLLPLETSIFHLPIDATPSPELYANVVTEILSSLFDSAKFITKNTAFLQATIAANAIISALSSFIRIAKLPGVGVINSENTFNSYFSALNGLGKLPYVGIETSNQKLPLIIKLTYASKYASKFSNLLFYNLIFSPKYLEAFILGVPVFNNKVMVIQLGDYVADAFGSPNKILFYDLFSKALLKTALNINRANFAKEISSATARALLLNGYFLSGNLDIQATIAKNAIIRALITMVKPISPKGTFYQIFGLPGMTQIEGVLPSQILLKYGTDIELNTNNGLRLGTDQSLTIKSNAGLKAGIDGNSGFGPNVNSGVDLGTNINLGTDIITNPIMGGGLGLKTDLGTNGGLGGKVDLGLGLVTNSGPKAGQSILGNIINAGIGSNVNIDSPGRFGANVGLGTALNFGSNADVYDDSSFDLIGLNRKDGFGVGQVSNAGYKAVKNLRGNDADEGSYVDANSDLDGILKANIGATEGLGTNIDLRTRPGTFGYSGANNDFLRGLGTNFGSNSVFGTVTNLNPVLEPERYTNTILATKPDINVDLSVNLDNNEMNSNQIQNTKRKKRSIMNFPFDFAEQDLVNLSIDPTTGLERVYESNMNPILGARVKTTLGTGSNLALNADADLGITATAGGLTSGVVLGLQPTVKGGISDRRLSILNILPLILTNKLYRSTALYTSVSMVGINKIINFISEAMATEFGLSIATIFLRSYAQCANDNADNNFEMNMVSLAKATTEALGGCGFLNSTFSFSTANQLADAIVAKFSSLITTSLEDNMCPTRLRWTNLLNQDNVQPSLIPGYYY